MRFAVIAITTLAVVPTGLVGQSLRSKVNDLFTFGQGCSTPICLDRASAGTDHGEHYNPAAAAGGANLISFLTNAIGVSIANIPLSAASGGAIWGRSPEGLPVRTATSSGPIFAERGNTLGRGRVLFSANFNQLDYRSLRGTPLSDLVFSFSHQDTDSDGLGNPVFESDIIEMRTSMSVAVTAITPVLSYGLTDRIDVSVAVPFIRASLSGVSEAQIVPFSNPTPHHFGTEANPLLRATSETSGSATGIGDVAVRAKAALVATDEAAFAVLGDVRLATGKEEDFLGAGGTTFSVLGIGSLRRGAFSPHINAGYIHRGGEYQTDAILATVGFDHLMGSNATLAVDIITSWQVGENKLTFPAPIVVDALVGNANSTRVVRPTNLTDRRDDLALASIGTKLGIGTGINLIANALVPLRQGGLQPNFGWTMGFEYSF
jgi:hypothetical protein